MRKTFAFLILSLALISCDYKKSSDSLDDKLKSTETVTQKKIAVDSLKLQQERELEMNGAPIPDIGNSLIFITEVANEYSENPGQVTAIPIVYFHNGKYEDIPRVMEYDPSPEDIKENERARRLLLPIIKSGNMLYALNNGVKEGSYQILNVTKYAISDWSTFSAILEDLPPNALLTDNEKIGTNQLGKITEKPVLKKRLSPENEVLEDKLLSKVDIDGDGFPEIIYQNQEYEGMYYTIYSRKNGKWKKVYEGGYQGV